MQPSVHQKVVRWSCHQLEEKTNGERSPKLQTLQSALIEPTYCHQFEIQNKWDPESLSRRRTVNDHPSSKPALPCNVLWLNCHPQFAVKLTSCSVGSVYFGLPLPQLFRMEFSECTMYNVHPRRSSRGYFNWGTRKKEEEQKRIAQQSGARGGEGEGPSRATSASGKVMPLGDAHHW